MNIALDFDKTYTEDPLFWTEFIKAAKSRNHNVWIVTARYADDDAEVNPVVELMRNHNTVCDGVYFTSRKAKKPFMKEQGIIIDVWIDDSPKHINEDWKS